MTKNQFDVLTILEKSAAALTQRKLSQIWRRSIGAVNKTVTELIQLGYVRNNKITQTGLEALEPFRVKRAVFIAAGFGSRLMPITLNTPKPLVRINGRRIIDSMLDAVVAAGIEEIYIVRGYLAEQFDQLLYKYPSIQFIENPAYNEANNISSVMCARDSLSNAYILEGDLLLYNPNLITKYQYTTNYLGVAVKKTDDWCLKTTGGMVSKIALGGVNCYHMFGISYWTQRDGIRLAEHVKRVYESPGGKERYWDQVALEYYIKEYKIAVRPCTFEDVVEIDTLRELKQIDCSYEKIGK
jgi:CTP:phosphocholine cytidylyltransferase-like protein